MAKRHVTKFNVQISGQDWSARLQALPKVNLPGLVAIHEIREFLDRCERRLTIEAGGVSVDANNRRALLATLTTMPDEAFGWFVVWASGGMMQYPDGLGGFRPDSRESITALRTAAKAFIDKQTATPTERQE